MQIRVDPDPKHWNELDLALQRCIHQTIVLNRLTLKTLL